MCSVSSMRMSSNVEQCRVKRDTKWPTGINCSAARLAKQLFDYLSFRFVNEHFLILATTCCELGFCSTPSIRVCKLFYILLTAIVLTSQLFTPHSSTDFRFLYRSKIKRREKVEHRGQCLARSLNHNEILNYFLITFRKTSLFSAKLSSEILWRLVWRVGKWRKVIN